MSTSLKEFHSLFNTAPTLAEEKNAFVQRINQTIFSKVVNLTHPTSYEVIFQGICYELGVNGADMIARQNANNFSGLRRIPSLRKITNDDFVKTLQVLVLLYKSLNTEYQQQTDGYIRIALVSANTDFGIRWDDGMFYPSGAGELDEKLIDENLQWLKNYPEQATQFKTALNHFQKSTKDISARKDAITNAYSSMEGVAQLVLSNKKNFDNNLYALMDQLSLPTQYKNIFNYYKVMANEYSSRHAGTEFSHEETEAFIYLTGILMRLSIQKLKT